MEYFVGYRRLEVTDSELNLAFPLAVLYPSLVPGRSESVGPYLIEVAPDAPAAPGRFTVVLISHGTGGSGLAYRTLAHYLARHGCVVGLPEHPFNNRDNDTWAKTGKNLAARPRHLQLAIDCLLESPAFASCLEPGSVGLIGHSLGGYTALALAGGQPAVLPEHSPSGAWHPIPVPADDRVKALVLLAPATPWFRVAGALRNVRSPILLIEAEKDAHTSSEHGQTVLNGVSDHGRITHRVVPNAGHFSFLSPFPAGRVSPVFPPSQDPPGFDRAAFHEALYPEILAFLRREMPGASAPDLR